MTRSHINFAVFVALLIATIAGFAVASVALGGTLETPGRTVTLPDKAAVSDGLKVPGDVLPLGVSVDPATGKVVEGFAIFHHRDGHGGGPGAQNGGGSSQCFAFLARGARWKTVEDWVFNTANTRGLGENTLFALQAVSLAKWEDATDGVVNGTIEREIFGVGATTTNILSADTVAPDSVNEVYFADVSSEGAIAVTIVWGVFSGPPLNRELVEWDQVYDDVDFDWSTAGEAGKMDFDNIATHENGHASGLGHPEDSCTEETMFRFADDGEIKKQSLNAGDIAGANELY